MINGGDPFYLKFLGQTDRVGAKSPIFSEREFTFTFGILSSVCNVRAPCSGDLNFPQYFYAILTLAIC